MKQLLYGQLILASLLHVLTIKLMDLICPWLMHFKPGVKPNNNDIY